MPELSVEQRKVLQWVFNESRSIFLTGPAGTGKTVTLNAIVSEAKLRRVKHGVTALTGSAAFLLGGKTLHSFLGIGLGKKDAKMMAAKTMRNAKRLEKLRDLEMLVIDEISMWDKELFEKISTYLQIIRRCQLPFGGVQLILCGDMCQLQSVQGEYCFLSKEWDRLGAQPMLLTKIFRQKDAEFMDMLSELRYGRCSRQVLERLRACKHTTFPKGIIPTRMYSLNIDVDRINKEEFAALNEGNSEGCALKYVTKYNKTSSFASTWTQHEVKRWADASGIPEHLELCPGTQVVITWNIGEIGVVNGTRGVVEKVAQDRVSVRTLNRTLDGATGIVDVQPITVHMEDDPTASVTFMPLKHAWAISIHKSQGMTLDCVEIDLGSSIFAYGQAYTALSRARNIESVRITDVKTTSFRTHPAVLGLYGII